MESQTAKQLAESMKKITHSSRNQALPRLVGKAKVKKRLIKMHIRDLKRNNGRTLLQVRRTQRVRKNDVLARLRAKLEKR